MNAAALLVVLVGPVAGSFLGVLVDRLPRGEDVVARPSSCRSCGARLGPLSLVPILSWLALRGRCASCGAPIPPMLLYLEILGAGAGVLAVAAGGGVAQVWASALFLWLLLGLGACDARWFRLPDMLIAALAVPAVYLSAVGPVGTVAGAVLGAGAFWALRAGYAVLRKREGLGLGDVKLMAVLGAYAGPWDLPVLTLAGAGLALALAVLQQWTRPRASLAARPIPFGTALCGAAAGIWFVRALGV